MIQQLKALIETNYPYLQIRVIKNDLIVFKTVGQESYHIRLLPGGYYSCNFQDAYLCCKPKNNRTQSEIIQDLNKLK